VLVLSGRPDHARVWEAVWVNPPVTSNANWRRHPAAVTSDRLADHLERWYEQSDGALRDAIARVRDWLDRIAEAGPVRG